MIFCGNKRVLYINNKEKAHLEDKVVKIFHENV